jgi:tRNA (guanosine-2'-O-)-methyltransferase
MSQDPAEILGEMLTDQRREKMERVLDDRVRAVTIVLENLYDPHNISAVLRSCEALGIQDIHIVETRHKLKFTRGITRGCEKWLTLHRYQTPAECAQVLHASGYEIAIADHHPETPRIERLDPARPRAYWMGAEHTGISDAARALADTAYRIPMTGFTESFNVSVAAALTMYTARTRWEETSGRTGDLDDGLREVIRLKWIKQQLRSADDILARFDVGKDRQKWRSPLRPRPTGLDGEQ